MTDDLTTRLLAAIERREDINGTWRQLSQENVFSRDIRAYLVALKVIVGLHAATGDGDERWCDQCGGDPVCPTLLAVSEALGIDVGGDSRPPASTESDERGDGGGMCQDRDPASTTASVEERADEFGFGYRESDVIA